MIVVDYKKFLKDASESANTQEHQLAENEIYSLQYKAGYAIHKLHKRIDKKTHQEVISVLLAYKGDENVMQNSKMIAALNRDGLWCITPELRSIPEIVEIKFRNFMVTNRKMVNIDRFVTDNMKDSSICTAYSNIISNAEIDVSESNGTLALQSILELYVKVRIFSYAKQKTEKGKEKIKMQKKGLRTELKHYEGSIADGSQMEEM